MPITVTVPPPIAITPAPHGALGTMLESLRLSIESDTLDLRISPQTIDARMVPQTELNRRFTFELQSRNSGKYRDRVAIRIDHTLKVSILIRINPKRQNDSHLDAYDVEEAVIKALMDRSDAPALSIGYDATRRTLLASREYLLIAITFSVSGDLPITS